MAFSRLDAGSLVTLESTFAGERKEKKTLPECRTTCDAPTRFAKSRVRCE